MPKLSTEQRLFSPVLCGYSDRAIPGAGGTPLADVVAALKGGGDPKMTIFAPSGSTAILSMADPTLASDGESPEFYLDPSQGATFDGTSWAGLGGDIAAKSASFTQPGDSWRTVTPTATGVTVDDISGPVTNGPAIRTTKPSVTAGKAYLLKITLTGQFTNTSALLVNNVLQGYNQFTSGVERSFIYIENGATYPWTISLDGTSAGADPSLAIDWTIDEIPGDHIAQTADADGRPTFSGGIVTFDRVDDYLALPFALALNTQYSFVYAYTADAGGFIGLSAATSSPTALIGEESSSSTALAGNATIQSIYVDGSAASPADRDALFTAAQSATTIGCTFTTSATDTADHRFDIPRIGQYPGGGSSAPGPVKFFALVEGGLTAVQLAAIQSYAESL